MFKSYIDTHTIRVGDFSKSLSPMDKTSRQKIDAVILEITAIINQGIPTDIYRIFHPNTK